MEMEEWTRWATHNSMLNRYEDMSQRSITCLPRPPPSSSSLVMLPTPPDPPPAHTPSPASVPCRA